MILFVDTSVWSLAFRRDQVSAAPEVGVLRRALEGGDTIDDFLEGFPTVRRQQVVAFLEEAKDRVVAAAS